MPDKGTEISEKLESIIENLLGKEFLINPFFRISKSTPEQLAPYKYINLKYSRELLALYLFISTPINFIKIIIQIFFSLFFSYQYLYFKPKNYLTEVLFVSHAIGANITKKDSDQFFALIPEYCAEKNLNTTIVYTNHTKHGYNKNLNLLNLKTNKVNRFLIPKFLKPKELIKYYLTIIVMFIKCVRIGVVNYFTDPLKSKILFSAANSFFKRPTYANYLLLLRIKDFYSENAIQVIFMTFEGHSYEQYLVNEINQAAPSLQVVLYQHSPITRAHLGIKNFMEKNIYNIIIMTTGTYYTNFLKQLSNIPEFVLIGSNKAEHLQENKEIYKSKTLLFAPEGTIAATKSFLKLIRLMSKEDPIHHYLLRLHPNLPRNIGVYFLIANLKMKQNFSISNNSLSTDLNLAKFVFYRSSAVGLQALNSNATPVFYSALGFAMLNVLPPNSNLFYSVNNFKTALDLVIQPHNKKLINGKKIIFKSLFSELKYQNLDNILTKN
jgi:hypothetical protein